MLTTRLAGKDTSRIGFGCGRLTGGAGMASSRAIVEAALALGIRHFDTAPVYGLGTADDVLGTVLDGDLGVTIVTKVGRQRPTSPGLRTLARRVLRPVLSLAPGLKARLARSAGGGGQPEQFSPDLFAASCADSLRRLRRSSVTGLLLHEIPHDALTDATVAAMNTLLRGKQTEAVGSGTGDAITDLVPFGTISQYRWAPTDSAIPPGDVILHGMLRHFPRPPALSAHQSALLRSLGRDSADPASWVGVSLTLALVSTPGAIALVSSNSIARLQQAVGAIDWSLVDECPASSNAAMRDLLTGVPSG